MIHTRFLTKLTKSFQAACDFDLSTCRQAQCKRPLRLFQYSRRLNHKALSHLVTKKRGEKYESCFQFKFLLAFPSLKTWAYRKGHVGDGSRMASVYFIYVSWILICMIFVHFSLFTWYFDWYAPKQNFPVRPYQRNV